MAKEFKLWKIILENKYQHLKKNIFLFTDEFKSQKHFPTIFKCLNEHIEKI